MPRGDTQPLVAGADHGVETGGVERQPAARLAGVHDRQRAVMARGRRHRVEVGHRAGAHLHGAEGHDVGVRLDRLGEAVERAPFARRLRALTEP